MSLVGRKITISKTGGDGPSVIAGVRTKTMTFGAETIDVTSDDDDGFRKLLEDAVAQRSLDMQVEGILKDAALLDAIDDGDGISVGQYSLTIPNIAVITGTFVWSDFEITGPYNDAATFSATLRSSGAFAMETESA